MNQINEKSNEDLIHFEKPNQVDGKKSNRIKLNVEQGHIKNKKKSRIPNFRFASDRQTDTYARRARKINWAQLHSFSRKEPSIIEATKKKETYKT